MIHTWGSLTDSRVGYELQFRTGSSMFEHCKVGPIAFNEGTLVLEAQVIIGDRRSGDKGAKSEADRDDWVGVTHCE